MCVAIHKECECGANRIQFHMRDNILYPEVISRLFCPECPGDEGYNHATMVNDNGWVIEYDMQLAKSLISLKKIIDIEQITPLYIFDQGYACWLEMYPGERDDIRREKADIVALLKVDQQQYLEKIQSWNIGRIEELRRAGWRKAQMA